MSHQPLLAHVDRLETLMRKAQENRWQTRVVLDGVATFAAHRFVTLPVSDDVTQLTIQTYKLGFSEYEQNIKSAFNEGRRSFLLMVSTIDQDKTSQDCWMSQAWIKGVYVEEMPHYPCHTRSSFILLLCPPKD